MYSLLIDSHGSKLSIVIYKNKVVERISEISFNNQSKIIIPTIIDLFKQCSITFADISEIIVVNGPGSFTGIRLGVTISKTIAYCLQIPIKSISTISLYAINVSKTEDFSIAIPDQKGYYIGEYNQNCILQKDFFYIDKNEFSKYKLDHLIIEEVAIDWNNIYKKNCLVTEDCYNIKPLYIKKIEVEK